MAMNLLEATRQEDVFPVVRGQVLHHIAHGLPPLHQRLQQVQLKNKECDSTNLFQVVKHVSHPRLSDAEYRSMHVYAPLR